MLRYWFQDETVFAPGDDALTGPRAPGEVPPALLLELMAMRGGRLVFERLGRTRLPLLVKVTECRFEAPARAGERLSASADLGGLSAVAEGATLAEARCEVRAGEAAVARGRLLFLCVSVPGVDLGAWAGLDLGARDGRR